MASPTQKSRSQPLKPPGTPHRRAAPAADVTPEVVDPVWLVKAIGITILAALICGYLTLCLLFYQGQWQLVLHPSHTSPAPSSLSGVPFQTIHFGVDETASPQLTGWLIPAEPADRYSAYSLLYLPSGDGSLAEAAPILSALHETGINIFAFDYRGYGQSAATRPNQKRMEEDAASAWQYLTVSRSLPSSHIVLFGNGIGCALAAQLAANHPDVSAVIFESPRPALIQAVLADPRTKPLPVRVLFHEDFAIVGSVSKIGTPKLFLLPADSKDASATPIEIQQLTASAASPKMTSTLNASDFHGSAYREQIVRFLDQYLSR